MLVDRRVEANMDQADKSLIELDVAGVHPSELLYAPVAAAEDVIPVVLISEGDLLVKKPHKDICELNGEWRQSFELMAERELKEGVEIDLLEAFEEVLTHTDLLN
jgi:hypothetical protein